MKFTEAEIAPARQLLGDADGILALKGFDKGLRITLRPDLPTFAPSSKDPRQIIEEAYVYQERYGVPVRGPDFHTWTEDWRPELNVDAPGWHKRQFVLVLAFLDAIPPLPATFDWFYLLHVCNYVQRDHEMFVAAPLPVRENMRERLSEICALFHLSYPSADSYQTELARIGLDWSGENETHMLPRWNGKRPDERPFIREAFYPIDFSQKMWNLLVESHPFPDFSKKGCPKPILLILSGNSD